MAKLLILEGPDKGREFHLDEAVITIGRGQDNTVRLTDPSISQRHSRISVSEGNLCIEDRGSTNGTFVNRQRISRKNLKPGDTVEIGSTSMVIMSDAPAVEKKKPATVMLEHREISDIGSTIAKGTAELERIFWETEARKADSGLIKEVQLKLTRLYEISSALNSTLDPGELLARTLDLVLDTLQADRGCVALVNAETGELGEPTVCSRRKTAKNGDFSVSHTILDRTVNEGVAILSSDAMTDARFTGAASISLQSIHSVMCAPLKIKERVLGAVYIDTVATSRVFEESDLQLFSIICNNAATAIANALAFKSIDELNKNLEQKVADRTAELTRTLRELREAQAQLIHSEKMVSLGQLVAGVAHELNNPINFVVNGIGPLCEHLSILKEMLARYDQLVSMHPQELCAARQLKEDVHLQMRMSAMDELAESIKEGATRTAEIVKDLRNFSRLDEAVIQTANVHKGIDASLNLLSHAMRGRIEVRKDYGDIPPLRCMASQLNQVFLNILNNAQQAIKDKGTITIKTRLENENIVITISDTGTGIPTEALPHIFDPFFTTKEVGQGTGLGLSISYGIVQRHGGEIKVQSHVGVGTTFELALPVNNQEILEQ